MSNIMKVSASGMTYVLNHRLDINLPSVFAGMVERDLEASLKLVPSNYLYA